MTDLRLFRVFGGLAVRSQPRFQHGPLFRSERSELPACASAFHSNPLQKTQHYGVYDYVFDIYQYMRLYTQLQHVIQPNDVSVTCRWYQVVVNSSTERKLYVCPVRYCI